MHEGDFSLPPRSCFLTVTEKCSSAKTHCCGAVRHLERPRRSTHVTVFSPGFGLVWNAKPCPAGSKICRPFQQRMTQPGEAVKRRVRKIYYIRVDGTCVLPYSGITLVRVNVRGGAESGLDFTYNRLQWGRHMHASQRRILRYWCPLPFDA